MARHMKYHQSFYTFTHTSSKKNTLYTLNDLRVGESSAGGLPFDSGSRTRSPTLPVRTSPSGSGKNTSFKL